MTLQSSSLRGAEAVAQGRQTIAYRPNGADVGGHDIGVMLGLGANIAAGT
jgi:hypothetical protein